MRPTDWEKTTVEKTICYSSPAMRGHTGQCQRGSGSQSQKARSRNVNEGLSCHVCRKEWEIRVSGLSRVASLNVFSGFQVGESGSFLIPNPGPGE